ncbi:MAG TPA: amidohydrolase family protein [Candidatus Limnocylindrales bacterium]|nr:amidohydrolase family protein [Candidatus Limnocylindrales bacterium]
MLDLAIRGGTVVTPEAELRADVGVADGRIAAIGEAGPAREDLDARGLLVLPGCVDLHVHLASRPAWTPLDGFETGTRAAAAGGVTTVVAFAQQEPGEGLRPAVERALADAAPSIVDFAFHVTVVDPSLRAIADVAALAADGHAGLKVFMVMPVFAERRSEFRELYRAAARAGALVAVHAEDAGIVARRTRELHEAGRTGVEAFPDSRPVEAEAVAVREAIRDSRETGASVYLVHLSSRPALQAVRDARAAGLRVHGECRPIYLYLTREVYGLPDRRGAIYVGQPPLREPADVEAVWAALADGTLATVGTDHIPHRLSDKIDPGRTFDRIPPGMANLETMLPMLHSEGVLRGRLTLRRLVEVLAAAPARIAGLAPRKGAIAVGADADLVLFDPALRRTVRAADTFTACDHDPFEGWEVTGWPVVTLSRGEVLYARGEIVAPPGRGRFVPRAPLEGRPA